MSNQPVVESLKKVLANSYALYLKTQNFHWNVTGPSFKSLHELFEEQYTMLAEAVDEIAERIRTIGAIAPGGFKIFEQLSDISEGNGDENAETMLKILQEDHETVIRHIKDAMELADDADDEGTEAFLSERLVEHEKMLWMISASA
jgi:starvation-inducible DNA-binding protein